ncbi:hypothetical protein C7H19_07890 [Aphanothece hegewaldii CCALA 016]|uniref:ABM domain-containing protein n=1 Tax=Aphanothece hegewaldii CCALA 016 TaxID=2107694 RepID=A0A2T1LZU6_9CHRO|nr:hypothetical protein [Aphanothece hegewaldii]PSF37890.1 hypothetical protein C7H19_07890 [Aphanothece hegewaldii CCALA 016]
MLNVLWGYPSIAKADKKPVQPLLFKPPEITIANIYLTTAESQKGAMSTIAKTSKTLYKKNPGFDGFVVLGSKDGNKIIVLSQWQNLESYQTYNAQPVEDYKTKYTDYKSKFSDTIVEDYKAKYAEKTYTSSKSKTKETAPPLEPSKTIIFELEQTQPNKRVAAIRKDSLIQLSEYTIKDPENETNVLDFVEKLIPTTNNMEPSPRSVVLLRSSDRQEIALLANWNCSADLEGLETTPSFAQLPEELGAVADNEQHLYEVLKIITPPPPEPETAS